MGEHQAGVPQPIAPHGSDRDPGTPLFNQELAWFWL